MSRKDQLLKFLFGDDLSLNLAQLKTIYRGECVHTRYNRNVPSYVNVLIER